jgi:hypothetical protein
LDGFDEIDFAHRDAISKQILDLSANYPRATIVVSSRPDEKFSAWQTFYIFTMRALDKGQVLELINKIDYDEALKERFKREVDSRLYKSHTSFLSSPLLSSIMLLTYEYFAEIPTKIHIFYEQAFAALFRRHDAQKSQFIRKTYANLPLDDFRNFFASFCAFSYLEERFTLLEGDLRRLTTRAMKYAGVKAKIDDVLRDLHECVCMLQRDGIHTIFVHRSFQEYFCAVFIANYHGLQVRSILDKCAFRSQDEVIPMLFEMSRERVDRDWALPHIDEIIGGTNGVIDHYTSDRVYRCLIDQARIAVAWKPRGKITADLIAVSLGDHFYASQIILRLYRTDKNYDHFEIATFLEGAIQRILTQDVVGREIDAANVEEALAVFGDVQKEEKESKRPSWSL